MILHTRARPCDDDAIVERMLSSDRKDDSIPEPSRASGALSVGYNCAPGMASPVPTVFISSTKDDLSEYREAARDAA